MRYFEDLGSSVKVIKSHELSISELQELEFTHLVISPGPCSPNESGICLDAIAAFAGKVPLLEVCLGHQSIGQVFGAK